MDYDWTKSNTRNDNLDAIIRAFSSPYGKGILTVMETERTLPRIKEVIFNDPATIVYWVDGTKTVVKCQKDKGDTFSKEVGLVTAIAKRACGNKGNFNDMIKNWIEK